MATKEKTKTKNRQVTGETPSDVWKALWIGLGIERFHLWRWGYTHMSPVLQTGNDISGFIWGSMRCALFYVGIVAVVWSRLPMCLWNES